MGGGGAGAWWWCWVFYWGPCGSVCRILQRNWAVWQLLNNFERSQSLAQIYISTSLDDDEESDPSTSPPNILTPSAASFLIHYLFVKGTMLRDLNPSFLFLTLNIIHMLNYFSICENTEQCHWRLVSLRPRSRTPRSQIFLWHREVRIVFYHELWYLLNE